jgi:hypothetical protein
MSRTKMFGYLVIGTIVLSAIALILSGCGKHRHHHYETHTYERVVEVWPTGDFTRLECEITPYILLIGRHGDAVRIDSEVRLIRDGNGKLLRVELPNGRVVEVVGE